MRRIALACITAAAALTVSAQPRVELSWTGQPHSYDVRAKDYEVTGFRTVRFGQTPEQVLAALRADLPAGMPTLQDTVDPVQRTRVLTIVAPDVAPGPGLATISYVFGATSQRLVAVNASWLAPAPATDAQRDALLAAGTSLVAELISYDWAPLTTARGHVIAPGVVVLFAARDARGAGVEVRMEGVALELQRPLGANGQVQPPLRQPAPPGAARLRYSVAAQPDRPDVYRLTPGQF